MQRVLDHREGKSRAFRQLPGELVHGRLQLFGRDRAIHEPNRLRFFRRKARRLDDEALRLGHADEPGKPLRAAGSGHDAERRLGLADARAPVLGHDPEVAAEGQLASTALRVPVDRGDNRLRAVLDGVVVLVDALHERFDLVRRVWRCAIDRPHRRQVRADAEVLLVGRGQHHGPDRLVLAQLREGRAQLRHQVLGDGVDLVAMHDHARNGAVAFDVDELAHQAVNRGMPPATSMTAPVMYPASPVQRNPMVLEMSSGCPNRLKTVRALKRAYIGFTDSAAAPASDMMMPGAMALDVMLWRPPSSAAVFARPMRPALVAE